MYDLIMGFSSFVAVLVVGLILSAGLKRVPQGEEWVIELLGRYYRTLKPGLRFSFPLLTSVRAKVDVRDTELDISEFSALSEEGAVLRINSFVVYRAITPFKTIYEIGNFRAAITVLAQEAAKNFIGTLKVLQALSQTERSDLADNIEQHLKGDFEKWGYKLIHFGVNAIRPGDADLQSSLDKRAAADLDARSVLIMSQAVVESIKLIQANGVSAETAAQTYLQYVLFERTGQGDKVYYPAELTTSAGNILAQLRNNSGG